MSEIVENIIFLVVGAGISFGTAYFLNERSHKLEREERKREREFAAREVRLKEAEELISINTREVYYFAHAVLQLLRIENSSQIQNVINLINEYFEKGEEADKGKYVYEVSAKSLDDAKLTNAWDMLLGSFDTYKKFCLSLSKFLKSEGLKSFQKLHDKYKEEEEELREHYFSSVTDFKRRVNEIRYQ